MPSPGAPWPNAFPGVAIDGRPFVQVSGDSVARGQRPIAQPARRFDGAGRKRREGRFDQRLGNSPAVGRLNRRGDRKLSHQRTSKNRSRILSRVVRDLHDVDFGHGREEIGSWRLHSCLACLCRRFLDRGAEFAADLFEFHRIAFVVGQTPGDLGNIALRRPPGPAGGRPGRGNRSLRGRRGRLPIAAN